MMNWMLRMKKQQVSFPRLKHLKGRNQLHPLADSDGRENPRIGMETSARRKDHSHRQGLNRGFSVNQKLV